jgi:phosphorylcholine metabolism protein LicD
MPLYKRAWLLLSNKQKKYAIFIFVLMLVAMILESLSVGIIVPLISILLKGNIDSTENAYNEEFGGITFPIDDLESLVKTKVYGREFLIPKNPEIYLEKVYGKNWKTPNKKQFFWNKKNLKQKL